MSSIFYNEFDPYCVQWLRNLITAGHLPAGTIDPRDIRDVTADSLAEYTTCHFFGGIGGWPYALHLAGWPATRPVWTASCPCQPFSQAGKRHGVNDERHLWPVLYRLISECRPATIFGEQVAGHDGRTWLAGVRTDLEAVGYAFGGADLCAASVKAPHLRQRLFWCATSGRSSLLDGVGHPVKPGLERRGACFRGESGNGRDSKPPCTASDVRRLVDALSDGAQRPRREECELDATSTPGGVVQSTGPRSQPRQSTAAFVGYWGSAVSAGDVALRVEYAEGRGTNAAQQQGRLRSLEQTSSSGFWDDYDIVPCEHGKVRRIEPGTFPLAHGVSARVGKLRAYGNAIVPQVAAAFIRAFLETEETETP